jgi:hypothetical protein
LSHSTNLPKSSGGRLQKSPRCLNKIAEKLTKHESGAAAAEEGAVDS